MGFNLGHVADWNENASCTPTALAALSGSRLDSCVVLFVPESPKPKTNGLLHVSNQQGPITGIVGDHIEMTLAHFVRGVRAGPHILGLHVVSVVGFALSAVLGVWLLWGVVRSGRL